MLPLKTSLFSVYCYVLLPVGHEELYRAVSGMLLFEEEWKPKGICDQECLAAILSIITICNSAEVLPSFEIGLQGVNTHVQLPVVTLWCDFQVKWQLNYECTKEFCAYAKYLVLLFHTECWKQALNIFLFFLFIYSLVTPRSRRIIQSMHFKVCQELVSL